MQNEFFLQELKQRMLPAIVTELIPVPNIEAIPDSTEKYAVQTTTDQFFLTISSEAAPQRVKIGVNQQRAARACLRGIAAEAIELPLLEGSFAQTSYAVWRIRQPLSSNRFRFKIEKTFLAPRIYRWLRDVTIQTATSTDASKLATDVERLERIPAIPAGIKSAARDARDGFLSGNIPAMRVLQHGDLWIGNILKAPSKLSFIVIDWPGSRIDGAPFFDLLKFATSARTSTVTLRHEISAHSRLMGCNPGDAAAYVLSGLGNLYARLEYFPEERFIDLCVRKMTALEMTKQGSKRIKR